MLFSTDHCTLCDDALELLFSMPELAGHSVRVVDVAADDTLIDVYGERLPVLEVSETGGSLTRRLFWPFDQAAVVQAIG